MGWGCAGQLFAQQQANDFGNAGFVSLTRRLDLAALITLVQGRFQIVTNTFQVAGSNSFDTSPFGGFENRPCPIKRRAQLAMCGWIVMGQS